MHAGWGNWVNTAVLALLLLILGQRGPDSYETDQLETVRHHFCIAIIYVHRKSTPFTVMPMTWHFTSY